MMLRNLQKLLKEGQKLAKVTRASAQNVTLTNATRKPYTSMWNIGAGALVTTTAINTAWCQEDKNNIHAHKMRIFQKSNDTKVTVRIWKSNEFYADLGHISVQSGNHYYAIHPNVADDQGYAIANDYNSDVDMMGRACDQTIELYGMNVTRIHEKMSNFIGSEHTLNRVFGGYKNAHEENQCQYKEPGFKNFLSMLQYGWQIGGIVLGGGNQGNRNNSGDPSEATSSTEVNAVGEALSSGGSDTTKPAPSGQLSTAFAAMFNYSSQYIIPLVGAVIISGAVIELLESIYNSYENLKGPKDFQKSAQSHYNRFVLYILMSEGMYDSIEMSGKEVLAQQIRPLKIHNWAQSELDLSIEQLKVLKKEIAMSKVLLGTSVFVNLAKPFSYIIDKVVDKNLNYIRDHRNIHCTEIKHISRWVNMGWEAEEKICREMQSFHEVNLNHKEVVNMKNDNINNTDKVGEPVKAPGDDDSKNNVIQGALCKGAAAGMMYIWGSQPAGHLTESICNATVSTLRYFNKK